MGLETYKKNCSPSEMSWASTCISKTVGELSAVRSANPTISIQFHNQLSVSIPSVPFISVERYDSKQQTEYIREHTKQVSF